MFRVSVPDLSQLLFVVDEHGLEVRCRFELGEFRNCRALYTIARSKNELQLRLQAA